MRDAVFDLGDGAPCEARTCDPYRVRWARMPEAGRFTAATLGCRQVAVFLSRREPVQKTGAEPVLALGAGLPAVGCHQCPHGELLDGGERVGIGPQVAPGCLNLVVKASETATAIVALLV